MPSREKLKIERNFESVTKSKSNDMKEGDLILVSAEATGLGKPMEAVIDKIETFMGQNISFFIVSLSSIVYIGLSLYMSLVTII